MTYKENFTHMPEAVSAEDWRQRAKCAGMKGEKFFVDGEPKRKKRWEAADRAKSICSQCPVKIDCLRTAIVEEKNSDMDHIYGIRGGLEPKERKIFIRTYRKTGQLPTSSERTHT